MANHNSPKHSDVELRNVFRRTDDTILDKSQIVAETAYAATGNLPARLANLDDVEQLSGPNKTKIYRFTGLSPHQPVHTDYTRLHRLCERYGTPIASVGTLLLMLPALAIMSVGGAMTPQPVGFIMQSDVLRIILAVAYFVGCVVAPTGFMLDILADGLARLAD